MHCFNIPPRETVSAPVLNNALKHAVEWQSVEPSHPKRAYEIDDTDTARKTNCCWGSRSSFCSHHSELSNPDLGEDSRYTYEGESLGRGAFGNVCYYSDMRSRSPVAVKVMEGPFAQRELYILKLLQMNGTPHIPHLRADFLLKGKTYIATDLLNVKDIFDNHLGANPPMGLLNFEEIITIALQSLKFLEATSQLHVIHFDLKPENMIYERDLRGLKILDFNLSRTTEEILLGEGQGSIPYVAPEVLMNGVIDCSVDIWSLGCVLYQLFTNSYFLDLEIFEREELNVNTIMHAIVAQIGMPSKYFLQNCCLGLADHLFNEEGFRAPLCITTPEPWQETVQKAALYKGLGKDETDQFISLLKNMLKFEDRATPAQLLASPLFANEVNFHLASDEPPKADISIYSAHDTHPGSNPCVKIDSLIRVHRSDYYLPKSPHNLYVVHVNKRGGFFSHTVTIQQGNFLHIDLETEQVFATNSPTPP